MRNFVGGAVENQYFAILSLHSSVVGFNNPQSGLMWSLSAFCVYGIETKLASFCGVSRRDDSKWPFSKKAKIL